MQEYISKPREYKYRNVDFDLITTKYRLPLAGRVSILHRVSGALLFLSLPLMVLIFQLSLNPKTFQYMTHGWLGYLLAVPCLAVLWAFFHHLCAGIRFLTLDLHIGLEKTKAQKSALIVFIVSLSLTVIFAIKFGFYWWGGYYG